MYRKWQKGEREKQKVFTYEGHGRSLASQFMHARHAIPYTECISRIDSIGSFHHLAVDPCGQEAEGGDVTHGELAAHIHIEIYID